MLGDSQIAYFDGWRRLDPLSEVLNYGRGGDNTFCVLKRAKEACAEHPKLIILQVGVNDLLQKLGPSSMVENHMAIWRTLAMGAPEANLLICSLLPVNQNKLKKANISLTAADLKKANKLLADMAQAFRHEFIDLFQAIGTVGGELPANMTDDGIHLLEPGYAAFLDCLKLHV